MQDMAQIGSTIKVLHVKALQASKEERPWAGNCISVHLPSAGCSIEFYAVTQPATILERPQVSNTISSFQYHLEADIL